MLFKLHQWLLDRYQAGEQTVLVVDEAQILSRQTLEEIRLADESGDFHPQAAPDRACRATGNRTETQPAGTPAASPTHRAPGQNAPSHAGRNARIYSRTAPHRAVATEKKSLAPPAIEAVHRHARGIPRVTNLLCEQALVRAFLSQRKPISAEIVEDVARDFSLDEVDLLAQPLPPQRAHQQRARPQATGRARAGPPKLPAKARWATGSTSRHLELPKLSSRCSSMVTGRW